MILSMSGQARVFLTTVAVGLFIGFVYDWFRVFRKTVPHANVATYLEDVLFWVFVSLLMFYVMLNDNAGEIRFFTVLGAFIGMLLYFLTISRLFMGVSMTIVGWVKKTIAVLCALVLAPFRWLCRLLAYPAYFCKKRLMKGAALFKKGLRKSKNYAKIKGRRFKKECSIILKKI